MPNPIVLKAEGLARHYDVSAGLFQTKKTVKALSHVSFELQAGKTLAVVGESGCGKSTLARQLTMAEKPTAGHLWIKNVDVTHASDSQLKPLRKEVQMVFQNPYGSLNPRRKIGDQLQEPLLINTRLSSAERQQAVLEMMNTVGLRPEHAHRYPHMFSGGQRQRIAIARAMMLKPSIVIADEPTSALDVSIQAQVLNLFMDLQEEMHNAYVFISHNLSVVEHMADDVMVMYLGKSVELSPKARLYKKPLHPYTQALLSATPQLHHGVKKQRIRLEGELPSPLNIPSGCAFHQRCPYASERCSQEEPLMRSVDQRLVACHKAEEFV